MVKSRLLNLVDETEYRANESFYKGSEKFHLYQKADLDKAIKYIMEDPDIGQSKTEDL